MFCLTHTFTIHNVWSLAWILMNGYINKLSAVSTYSGKEFSILICCQNIDKTYNELQCGPIVQNEKHTVEKNSVYWFVIKILIKLIMNCGVDLLCKMKKLIWHFNIHISFWLLCWLCWLPVHSVSKCVFI